MDTRTKRPEKKRGSWLTVLTAALIATVVSVLLTVAFAFVLQKQWLGMESISFINTGIKIISAAAAALIVCLRAPSRAPLKGALASAAYMALAFLLYSLLSGGFRFETGILIDLAMCALAGAITGMLTNLLKK